MIANRDFKKYWETNIFSDILPGDFISYVAKIVTLCPGTFWPDTIQTYNKQPIANPLQIQNAELSTLCMYPFNFKHSFVCTYPFHC